MTNPLTNLYRFIIEHFDREELRTFCFHLGVEYDDLVGEGRAAKARELVRWMGRRKELDLLVEALKRERPGTFDEARLGLLGGVDVLYAALPTFETVATLSRDQELAYLDDLLTRYKFWLDHYTPLAGIAEVHAAVKDGPRLDLPMPFIPPGFEKLVEHGYGARIEVQREPVNDLRAAVTKHRRIILLGEPGSGKTTTLWRLAFDYAQVARDDDQAPLPVLVPLGSYSGLEPFDAYLARHLGPLAPHLETYRASKRMILLLDGLNEMPQAGYAERVKRIQDALDRSPSGIAVITCRALDYAVKLEPLQEVEVSPLDNERIQTFLNNYLGETAGQELFQAMTKPLLAMG